MSTQNINNVTSNRGVAGDSAPLVTVAKSKAAAAEQPVAKPARAPSPESLQRMVDNANHAMVKVNSNLAFSVDDATNKTVIKVTESQSGKIIMQFPSEEMLAITRAIDHAQNGTLLKEKA